MGIDRGNMPAMSEIKEVTYVQKLASAKCPECEGLCPSCTPGLEVNTDDACSACDGVGVLVPGLRRACSNKWCGKPDKRKKGPISPLEGCMSCQGRGWILIQEAEQMGVLVRFALTLPRALIEIWPDCVHLLLGNIGSTAPFASVPEEALARAIYQAQGVE